MNIDEKYKKAGEIINTAGGTPIPVNDTLIKILKYFIKEDELDFITAFSDKKSQTMEQLTQSSGLSEEEIIKKVKNLSRRGVIFNQPNSKGLMFFRLLPLVNVGTFEYTFMGKIEKNERNREISLLFDKLFAELEQMVQTNYDALIPHLSTLPPVDRTVPIFDNKPKNEKIKIVIDQEVSAASDKIVPTKKVEEIAVGHCFCRHHKDMSGTPLQTDG